MKQPKVFEDPTKPNHVCRIHKVLYGLLQASQAWFTKLEKYLVSNGFHAFQSDTSLFVPHSPHPPHMLLYMSTMHTLIVLLQPYIEYALKRTLVICIFFLVCKSTNMMSTVLYHNMPTSKTFSVGATCIWKIQSQYPWIHKLVFFVMVFFYDPTLYRQIVGSLQHVTITRPDIIYSVNSCTHLQTIIGNL